MPIQLATEYRGGGIAWEPAHLVVERSRGGRIASDASYFSFSSSATQKRVPDTSALAIKPRLPIWK